MHTFKFWHVGVGIKPRHLDDHDEIDIFMTPGDHDMGPTVHLGKVSDQGGIRQFVPDATIAADILAKHEADNDHGLSALLEGKLT